MADSNDGSCILGERVPLLLATRGDDRKLRNIRSNGGINIISNNRSSAASRRGRSCNIARVAGAAVLLGLVLVKLVAIFGSIENNPGVPRSTRSSSASMAAVVHHLEDETTTTTATTTADVDETGATIQQRVNTWAEEREDTTSGAAGTVTSAGAGVAKGKPNVFFIMIDDMGWNDIGYQSTDLVGITPNLDKLAAGGVKMTQYYSMSICTPARASLMTGRYPIRYGLHYNVIQPGAPWGLPLTEKIFPEYMNDAGYESHMVGKWHLGSYRFSHTPHRRGFETFLGYLNDEEMYWTHQVWSARLAGHKFFDFGFGNATDYYDIIDRTSAPTPPSPHDDDAVDDDFSTGPTSTSLSSSISFRGEYSTTVFQERAMELVRNKTPHDDNPLFLYLSQQAVHEPLGHPPTDAFTEEEWAILDALEESSGSARRLRFAKVLMYLDKTIGELVAYLEEEGWMENSIIVVTSDNGGCPSAGGSNYPLRGMKHSYWEGAVKVPAFVYSKSHIPEEAWGTEYGGLMHVTDWLPTLATAADFEPSGSKGNFDGINHWAHITSPDLVASSESPRTEMLYNVDPYILWADRDTPREPDYLLSQGAYRLGKWKFIFNTYCQGYYTFDRQVQATDNLTNSDNTCQATGGCTECGAPCPRKEEGTITYMSGLFDLEADPREEHNVMDLHPEVVDDIRARIKEVVEMEYANSFYMDVNPEAYNVWNEHNLWAIPWFEILAESEAAEAEV